MKISCKVTASLAACVLLPTGLQGQKPPEIPNRMQAWSDSVAWRNPGRTFLSVESRRAADPIDAADIKKNQARAMQTLHSTAIPVVADRDKAELEVSLLVDPEVRYGMFHYQIAPYVYLLVRDRASGQLGYCAFRRLSRMTNQTNALLEEWHKATVRQNAPTAGSLEECAAQAMRPLREDVRH